ncbi:SnoaL-like protein [Stackebrandtia endophytica]|uniref:SnoaL-like protein n=1 Tax=Stackebrandtia endophytica TaxID=1496996 RepID=A0A543APX0_9ACTN|nr:nuclear transport factor 2 family protein [Stackebrandtia endophytica]TQL74624.1 SnoaL-like protein [Stackebrandtia endophytica]
MNVSEAADRWAHTWATAWPDKDADAILALQAHDGDHWASLFRHYPGRDGLARYLREAFDEETTPASVWFGTPTVDGHTAAIEYWAHITTADGPLTISGCTVVAFNDDGLVQQARDYSHATEGHQPRPDFA